MNSPMLLQPVQGLRPDPGQEAASHPDVLLSSPAWHMGWAEVGAEGRGGSPSHNSGPALYSLSCFILSFSFK